MALIFPAMQIKEASLRLARISDGLHRYLTQNAAINLELTMFNYHDVINNMRLAYMELNERILSGQAYVDSMDIGLYDFEMDYAEYKELCDLPEVDYEKLAEFGKRIAQKYSESEVTKLRNTYDFYKRSRSFCDGNRINYQLINDILTYKVKTNKTLKILEMNTNWTLNIRGLGQQLSEGNNLDIELYGIRYDNSCPDYRKFYKRTLVTDPEANNYRISNDSFDVSIVPCMYDCSVTSSNLSAMDKTELKMLKRGIRYTAPGGIIIVSIYKSRLYKDICQTIAKNLDNVRIYNDDNRTRMNVNRELVSRYCNDNIIIVGTKIPKQRKEIDADIFTLVRDCAGWDYSNSNYSNPLDMNDIIYQLPQEILKVSMFRGTIIDEDEVLDMYKNSTALKAFYDSQHVDKISDKKEKSLLPFTVGQLGIILTSGCLDGPIDEGDDFRHAIKGRIIKSSEKETIIDNNTGNVEYRETFTNKVEINVFLPNGEFKKLA